MSKSGDTINVNGSNTIIANADNLEVNSSNTSNQILLSSGTVGTAATFGQLPLGNSNSVTGILPIANGGTNTSSFAAGSRLIATNSGNTALESTSINPNDIVMENSDTLSTLSSTTTISTISTSSNYTYLLKAHIVADSLVTNKAAGFAITALFKNDLGILIKVSDDILKLADSGVGWTASVSTSGSNILIRVKGALLTDINWKCTYSTVSVQNVLI